MSNELEPDDLPLTRERDPAARHAAPRRAPPRAAERESPRGESARLTRQSINEDAFHIPLDMIPANVSYEWKRKSCYGMPDNRHMNQLKRNHWREVPQDRHPDYLVEQDGMVLMERPSYLTNEAHQEDYLTARGRVEQVSNSVRQTPDGHFTREHESARRATKIRSVIERMPIPEE